MNEFIEIQFRKSGKRLRVRRQLPGGIELDESDPIERTVGIQFSPSDAVARVRTESIRRMQGWEPGQFNLKMSVEDGSLILRGVDEHALPEGKYKLRVQLEEALSPQLHFVTVDHDNGAVAVVDLRMDDRGVNVDLDEADPGIIEVLERSEIDGTAGVTWLADGSRRPTRRACLLNLMASLRTRPTSGNALLGLIDRVYKVANDRIYARVDRRLLDTLRALVKDPARPFFEEGSPHASIHGLLLAEMPVPIETKARFKDLISFRAEGKPSMQVVVAVPPPDVAYTYADLDLDLGNPLQSVSGFFVHMGELLDGKPTNHLDLRKPLAKTKAAAFLYYTVSAS